MIRTTPFSQRLERTVTIRARRELVYRYFTDAARWASWWGAGSSIEARAGGRVRIRYPDGTEASGEVLELEAPERIVFSYGYASGKPIPAGGSRVTIRLEAVAAGTRLHLAHEFDDAAILAEHEQGWRYQLALFANVVANEVNAQAQQAVDGWFAAWSEPDAEKRDASVTRLVSPEIEFRDRYSLVQGLPDLLPHLAAVHRFMPGSRLRREGEVRHCQGTALADWVVLVDGRERARGSNVFHFDADGRIEAVTGLWSKAPGA
jgi:uncharacterized protein YndB with AHSA1/START domain